MRVVLDTNVLISALLKPGSVPGRALGLLMPEGNAAGAEHAVLYDARIALEYQTVLQRPKFKAIDRAAVESLLARIRADGELVVASPAYPGALTDDDDRMFIEVALAGRADAIVTGNIRDYPTTLGVPVYPPATLLATLEARGEARRVPTAFR